MTLLNQEQAEKRVSETPWEDTFSKGGRWNEPASKLLPSERFCTCCGKEIKNVFRYLELDQRTGTYHDLGGVPLPKSQGCFPFGLTCAKKMIKQHLAKIEKGAA